MDGRKAKKICQESKALHKQSFFPAREATGPPQPPPKWVRGCRRFRPFLKERRNGRDLLQPRTHFGARAETKNARTNHPIRAQGNQHDAERYVHFSLLPTHSACDRRVRLGWCGPSSSWLPSLSSSMAVGRRARIRFFLLGRAFPLRQHECQISKQLRFAPL
jgi:hypothetical protein